MNRTFRLGLLSIAFAMAGALRADDKAAPTPATGDQDALRADNKQLTDELAAAWKESDRLKAELASSQAASAKSAGDIADLQRQLDAARAAAPKQEAAPAPDADSGSQLADTKQKLETALRSFTVVQNENADLKAEIAKLTADNAAMSQQLDAAHASNAALQAQAAATTQIDPLRTELRQANDAMSRLEDENAQLRTRLSLQANSPGSSRPVPTRPGQEAAIAAELAAAEPAASAKAPAASAAPAPRTYVVAEGDTLTRISKKFYGTASRWQEILDANKGVVRDEKSLSVGVTLKIP